MNLLLATSFVVSFQTVTLRAQPLLTIQPGVELNWPTTVSNTYRAQWSSNPGGPWTDLSGVVTGNGSTNTFYDAASGGARAYRVQEVIPGTPAISDTVVNGGFESGTGSSANNWTVTTAAGGPVYAVRTNSNPHSGSFNYEVHLASTGAGPVVEFAESGVPVTAGTTYPFTFYSKALTGSQGQSPQWRILWNAGGDTGYRGFTAGNNVYTLISNSVTAPAGATSASIIFRIPGAAITSQSANIEFDDVSLSAGGGSSPGSPAQTNMLQVATRPITKITFPTTAGTQYLPESTTNLSSGNWTNFLPAITGDGGSKSLMLPMLRNGEFVRLKTPAQVVLPPTGLHTIASGSSNAVGLAWTASATTGVNGYRVLYGTSSGTMTNTTDVGNVTSVIVSGLTPGQTYFLAVVTLGAGGQSLASDATISAQPDTDIGIVSLFNEATSLEPPTTVIASNALITYIADRVRDRHARESEFQLYDHYLSWYWEQRVANIQIIDHVAKGGTDIIFNYTTLDQLSASRNSAPFFAASPP